MSGFPVFVTALLALAVGTVGVVIYLIFKGGELP